MSLLWNQNRDGLADYLFGQIAKDTFCALVPCHDDAVKVFADDGIIGGFDNGGNSFRRAYA